jgi:hypothetical protein
MTHSSLSGQHPFFVFHHCCSPELAPLKAATPINKQKSSYCLIYQSLHKTSKPLITWNHLDVKCSSAERTTDKFWGPNFLEPCAVTQPAHPTQRAWVVSGFCTPGYQWPSVMAQHIYIWPSFPPTPNGSGTKCVVPRLTPGRDLYLPPFTPVQTHTQDQGSITWELLFLVSNLETSILSWHGYLKSNKTRRNHRLLRASGNNYSRADIRPIIA